MTAEPSRRRSVLTRLLIGVTTLVLSTTLAAWLMHAGIDADGERAEAAITTGSITARGPLAGVRTWSLYDTSDDVDLAVVDPAVIAGQAATPLPTSVEALKRRDGRTREVLARVYVATLEPAQYEWLSGSPANAQGAGALVLNDKTASRDGRAPVAFWNSDWQAAIVGSAAALVDRLAAAGFDGLYIADGDAYLALRTDRPTAEAEFADLVSRISQRAKAINPDFAIVLANAEELVTSPALKWAVDAVAREDLFYGTEEPGRPNARSAVVSSLHFLARARREGRLVLVAEHLEDPANIAAARSAFAQHGFLGSISSPAARLPLD